MKTVLAIVGPTASGKSVLAEDVAMRRNDIEIVAVDAFTVYRGMDIGTAKPTRLARELVPHHMIDVLDPEDEVSVQWFQSQAREAIAGIHERGNVPLLVGGSGLYFRAVVDDLRFPPTDAKVRARLESEHEDNPEMAHKLLKAADPVAARRIDSGNARRIIRALEVIELTGERFSSFTDTWEDFLSIYDLYAIRLQPMDLDDRIDQRTEAMLAAGLLDEAGVLRGRDLSRTAQQAIGYAEVFAVFDGRAAREDLHEAIARRTRRYARRQLSWFKRDDRVLPLDPDDAADTLVNVRA